MATILGRQLAVGFAKEGTRNTAQTTAAWWLPVISFDDNVKNEPYIDNSNFGVLDEVLSTEIQYQDFESKLEFKLDANNLTNILYYFFGQLTPTTALGATTWVGTNLNNAQPLAFTLFFQNGVDTSGTLNWYKVNGCQIKDLEIKAEAGGDATCSITITGLARTAASTQTVSYTAPSMYLYGKHFAISYATTVSGLSSPTAFDTRSFSLKLSNETVDDKALGSLTPVDEIKAKFKTEFKFSYLPKTAVGNTLETNSFTGIKQAFQIVGLRSESSVIGTSTLKPTLKFIWGVGRMDTMTKTDKDAPAIVDATFMPQLDTVAGYTVQATLINSTSATA